GLWEKIKEKANELVSGIVEGVK
uniref:Caerin-3.3 n=1 Tax=Ranoidea caerulea TaxID=30344 RepID=CR33_RANCA|nr:RecName: Full=Caerin-3.3 [Ranoidea caerulea]